MTKLTYDERQTAACKELRYLLQSIEAKALEAMDCIGSDPCTDWLVRIAADVVKAQDVNNRLVRDDI